MCNFLSAITLKDGSIRIGPTDSHSAIIDFHKIQETGIRGIQLVKLELVPKNIKDPISKWKFIVDQDLIPEWFDKEKVETRFRKMMEDSKIHTIYDEYLAKMKPIDDEYLAKMKTIDDEYDAKMKPIEDEYSAKWKPIKDEYLTKRKPFKDEYNAKRKTIEDEYGAKRKTIDDEYEDKRLEIANQVW